ncbi:MAG TPA: FAD-dependent oxidoreductase [Candidatus Cybelea sp.]|jgi:thioredoxin reductase (NADPH)
MFTREDLRVVPLFSELGDRELEYLAKTSADLRLLAGEYVIHEGETRRALFVLMEGRVEVVKVVDGVERAMGARAPGETFGELPFALNTPYAVSFRAAQNSRIMRIEPKDFHVVASSAPSLSSAIDALAMERVGGLQDLAAEGPSQPIAVIGPQWDNETHILRDFLQRNSVDYDSVAPEAPGPYPVVRLRDGKLLSHPSIRELAKAIGLCVSATRSEYDVVIVGAGPAGLAAAVYGASEGLSTMLLEREAPGGQAGTSSGIENYLGFPFGISGDDLAHRALERAKRLGADIIVTRDVTRVDPDSRTLTLDGGDSVRARAIIVASGVTWRHLNIASVDGLLGRGVYYGAAPGEARFVLGQDIFLVGGGNSAGQAAVNFSSFARSVTLLVRGDSLAKSMSHYLVEQLGNKPNVAVQTHAELVNAYGEKHLEAIDVADRLTGKATRRDASALFILIGADAETSWLPLRIARDDDGYVLTGPAAFDRTDWRLQRQPYLLETSVPGIFAVGDVRAGSIKRVAAAVGEGSMAIAFVHQYLG